MFVLFCYIIAFLPIVAATALWFFSKKIVWWESSVLSVIGIVTVVIMHYVAIRGATIDTETWSGQVTDAVYIPEWLEYYEYAVYRTEYYTETESYTDSDGKSHTRTVTHSREVFDHWESSTRFHSKQWYVTDTVNGSFSIDEGRYEDIVHQFGGGKQPVIGCRTTSDHNSRMLSGDKFDYHAVNKNGFIYPTTATRTWENKVKAAPSVFRYQKVPENVDVFNYPTNPDKFISGRIVGKVGVETFKWDQMNSLLGPQKLVNVIAVGLEDKPMADTDLIEAKWVGGKKNDIVIVFGGSKNICKPTWCRVFGWSESELCKRNLETIVLKHGMTDKTIPFIQEEIKKNYTIFEWSKFDYLTVEVPLSGYIWLIVAVLITTGGWIWFILLNDLDKENNPCISRFPSYDRLKKRYPWNPYKKP